MKYIFSLLLFLIIHNAIAQDSTSVDLDKAILGDTFEKNIPVDTSRKFLKTMSKVFGVTEFEKPEIPRIAFVRSLILPGWGQFTNHDYWKLPLIYGAAGAGWYFGNVINNRKYKQYLGYYEQVFYLKQNAVLLSDNTPLSSSASIYLSVEQKKNKVSPIGIYFQSNNVYYELKKTSTEQFEANVADVSSETLRGPYAENTLLSAKNQYRRWRDLSRIGFTVGWLFFAIEANATAHLKAFDVTDNISMQIKPAMPRDLNGQGIGVNLTFNLK